MAAVAGEAATRVERPLQAVSNPPPVQMLVPGFTVRELSVIANNINNLVFAPDGRLFALCYDGNVLQLRDVDGDGLEDLATYFFRNDKNEIPPSIGMCWGPGGLYIASQRRVMHLRDQGDGTGKLMTVTSDWPPPTAAAGSNLDAVGIAVNKVGEIFFGLGCDAWNQAYRVNPQTGKSEYNLHSERGTILKISPDWKRREVVSTGMRFPVGMALNAAGDLFATDQEGATWLPNGNPFDELLHIQPGRHYGFPPRHPVHLPDVVDEPSTFDYGPQHQSTCGLHFNDGPRVFGPEWWRGDAIVAGEARGKIWRTQLVKSAAGYVAQSQLIACLSLLTIDAVPTPQGDLLVACHTGKPDWGTGPQGQGRLFKISYTNKAAPQPVFAYAVSPTESRVVFDRPLPAAITSVELAKGCAVTMGKYVAAGDRFESISPGYQAVKNQRTMPRFELPVVAAEMSADKRSLTVKTSPRTEAVSHALTLPSALAGSRTDIDLAADLTGIEASWHATTGTNAWTGWLPHLDLTVARGLTRGSLEHRRLFDLLGQRGSLRLKARLDLWQMLRAATQPDSKLDFDYPPEKVTLVLKASLPLQLKLGANFVNPGKREARITVQPEQHRWLPVEIIVATGGTTAELDVSWMTAEDSRPRPLPRWRVLLPCAQPYAPVTTLAATPEIDGGNWLNGKKIFFSEPAACSKCHKVGGEGGNIGPDLSNLIFRDYASVLKDITEPNAAINPDHISYVVQLKDGESESGVVLVNNEERVVLGQVTGKDLMIPREKVASMKPSAVSVMPEGLLKLLSPQDQKDLMTFLLIAH